MPKTLSPIATHDFNVSMKDGYKNKLRLYAPEKQILYMLIVFYHGGGYVVLDIEHYDLVFRWMTHELGCLLISVNYRLAPEHPLPTPVEDGYPALEWIANSTEKLNIHYKSLW